MSEAPASGAHFQSTHWSVVLAAGSTDAPQRRAALEQLCGTYWYPLYAFARRRGLAREEAADLVQGFFALLLERDDLRRADPARGRFRNFLLSALQHALANQRERERALRRGGGQRPLSFDLEAADARFAREPADARTPELAYRRAWAEAALARALSALEAEQQRIGRAAHFRALAPALSAESDAPAQAEVARALGLSENAVKVALHRLRRRFAELLRAEVAGTLERPDEIEDELRELFAALARP